MFKGWLKWVLIIILGIQFFVVMGTLHEFFNIGLISAMFGFLIFMFPIIIGSDVLIYLRTRPLDTLIYMNTTLFMTCLTIKDSIYSKLIKNGVNDLGDQLNAR